MNDEDVPIPILYRPAVRQTLFLIIGLTYGMILIELVDANHPMNLGVFLTIFFCTIVLLFLFGDEFMIWHWTKDEDF